MDKNLFVGREYEIRQLEKYRESKEAEFVIIYGRRRVGKTSIWHYWNMDRWQKKFQATGWKPSQN